MYQWLRLFTVIALTMCVAETGHAADKTFLDYCKAGKAGNTPGMWHTVEVMKTKVAQSDCDVAWRKLTGLTVRKLGYNKITDLTPLAGLTGLETLHLGENPIDPAKCPTSEDTAKAVREFCIRYRKEKGL